MSISRRQALAGTTGIAALALAGGRPAAAAGYPTKPVRLIIGYVPGGTTDVAARILAQALTPRLGQTVLVENKPGAETAIAVEYVVKSAADGYTLVFGNEDGTAMLAAEKPSTPYKIPGDFSFISRVIEIAFTLAVSAKLPAKSLAEFVAYAKANPGKIRYGSVGVGSATHVAGLLLEQAAGIKMTHVPYRGAAPAMTDLLGGFIDMSFQTLATIGDQAKSDKIRLIAVTSEERQALLPDVPTMKESGYPGATMASWLGVLGPAGLPPDVLDRLRKAVVDVLNDDAVKQQYIKIGLVPSQLVGDAFEKLMVADYQRWKQVAEAAHLVIE